MTATQRKFIQAFIQSKYPRCMRKFNSVSKETGLSNEELTDSMLFFSNKGLLKPICDEANEIYAAQANVIALLAEYHETNPEIFEGMGFLKIEREGTTAEIRLTLGGSEVQKPTVIRINLIEVPKDQDPT